MEVRQEGPPASRHQVWEVPEVKPHVTEWRLEYGYCAGCQHWTQGELPEGVPAGAFGPRLMALVAYMTGLLRLPKRPVQWLLRDVLGVEVALGSISKVEAQVSQALAEPVEQARQYIREQTGPVHLDDTGWHEGPLRKALWVAATALVAVFLIAEGRSKKVAQLLRRVRDGPLERGTMVVSFGTKSPEGSRFIERILTAVTTLRLQNRPVLPFLTQAVESRLHGHSAPSLLPSAPPPRHAAA